MTYSRGSCNNVAYLFKLSHRWYVTKFNSHYLGEEITRRFTCSSSKLSCNCFCYLSFTSIRYFFDYSCSVLFDLFILILVINHQLQTSPQFLRFYLVSFHIFQLLQNLYNRANFVHIFYSENLLKYIWWSVKYVRTPPPSWS